MAFISNTRWLIILALFHGVCGSSVIKDLKLSSFDCSLDIIDVNWVMQCQSVNGKAENQSSKFFVVKLHGTIENTSPLSFGGLLNSTIFSLSEIYQCNNMWRYIMSHDRSFAMQNCANTSQYLEEFVEILNVSFVTTVTISDTSESEAILNILSELFHLEDVRVWDSSIRNMTKLPVHSNNCVRRLTLRHDRIQSIGTEVFINLPCLETLDLSNNALKLIEKKFFGNVTTISTLDISFNFIEYISSDAFSNLLSLQNLFIQNNNLKSIHESIFQYNSVLSIIDISNNVIKYFPSKVFHHLPGLKNISCSNCSLSFIDKKLFLYSAVVTYLNFSHNFIQEVSEYAFKNITFLQELDLGYNNISYLDNNFLPNQFYLEYLNLANNNIPVLKNGYFRNARNIHHLDLKNNKLKILTDQQMQNFTDLEDLDLTHNLIEKVELGKKEEVRIRRLLLADNQIVKFNVTWKKLSYLEYLKLDNNKITNLDVPPCIPSVKQTITFSFKHNKITTVNMDSLLFDENKAKSGVRMDGCYFNGMPKNFIDLTHNPLLCDCNMFRFYKYITARSAKKYQLDMFLNVHDLTCAAPQHMSNKSLTSLSYDDFSCSFTNTCPHPCTCGVRGKDNMTFVNCSAKSLKDVPKTAPDGTTVLYFNNNKLRRTWSLNGKIWSSLKELHVDNNELQDLKDWTIPPSLDYLSARGNKLKKLPTTLMQFISNQTSFQLYLGGNDNNCTCDRAKLKNFLIKNKAFVKDLEDIVCEVTNNGTSDFLPLVSVPDNTLCPTNYSQRKLIISLCVFFLLLICMVLLYYRYRRLILSFLYVYFDELFHLCYFEDEYDEDNFDAFVAYSSCDREIVLDLLHELEESSPYFNLCIHERNWLPGQYISDNIINSVQNSRRTIMILSNAFIASPWFNLELKAAVFKMSKDKMNKIIVILKDKSVSLSSIEPELRHVISRRTYLVWGERWFWEKLRYVMPRKKHIPKPINVMRPQRSASEMALVPTNV